MTILTFPALRGQTYSTHKKPTFATLVAEHVSGREVRDPQYVNPIWNFEITFSGLDSGAVDRGLGAASLQTLMGFYLQMQGQYGSFLFYDPTDFQVSAQAFGTGDGVTTTFQLARSLGGFLEPIVAPLVASGTIAFGGGQPSVSAAAPVITAAGATVSASNYSISSPGGIVTFTTAPASGAALAWSGSYAFLCRFDADDMDFEQFMAAIWRAESVKLRSLRPA